MPLTGNRRTYDDEDEGQVVKDGFDPRQLDPKASTSAIDDSTSEETGEDRGKGPTTYDSMDDRHVWNARDGE